jgi:hypothetical protein
LSLHVFPTLFPSQSTHVSDLFFVEWHKYIQPPNPSATELSDGIVAAVGCDGIVQLLSHFF